MAALAVAQAAGDLDTSVIAADALVECENRNLAKSLKQLAPRDGDALHLEEPLLPSEAWVGEASVKLRRVLEEAERERYASLKSEERLEQAELQKRQVADEAGAISPEQVSDARASRDLTLDSIRVRVLAGTFHAKDAQDVNVLSNQIHVVDDVTDQKIRRSHAV